MAQTILITGGAGFIGRRLSRMLLERGDRVRVLDSFIDQVHGGRATDGFPDGEIELIRGDVRDEDAVSRALEGVDKVVHLAADALPHDSWHVDPDVPLIACRSGPCADAAARRAACDRLQADLAAWGVAVAGGTPRWDWAGYVCD